MAADYEGLNSTFVAHSSQVSARHTKRLGCLSRTEWFVGADRGDDIATGKSVQGEHELILYGIR